MNPLFIPTLVLAAILFFVGLKISKSNESPWFLFLLIIAALPAIAFAAYYTKIFGEAKWFYWFRSQPFTELTAAGIAGWLQYQRFKHPRWKKVMSAFFIPFLMVLCVSVPYLKQIFLRPDWSKFEDRWSENVCLQSSESSCGPASAATLLRHFGSIATEQEIARESFTSRRGTENWYLLRTLARRGLAMNYAVVPPGAKHMQFPSIAGVKLNQAGGAGHFIALLGKTGEAFIVGDPLNGREILSLKELEERYAFTGFYLIRNEAK